MQHSVSEITGLRRMSRSLLQFGALRFQVFISVPMWPQISSGGNTERERAPSWSWRQIYRHYAPLKTPPPWQLADDVYILGTHIVIVL